MKLRILAVLLLLAGCRSGDRPLYRKLDAKETGIGFVNEVVDTPELNIINYLYFYDGAGVAAGDVNGDGLSDLYFTANRGPNRLYLNRGGLRFEDVTDRAGVAGTSDWNTGVTMADVNDDGRLDLYVMAVGGHAGLEGSNELFVNNGDGTFTERAAEYGLDFRGYSTQATFFDYDGDGDLDVFLLNHSTHEEDTFGTAEARRQRDPEAGDRLYENVGGRFVDVSEKAGIYGGPIGYGLGIVVSDLDVDGRPDVYVANDFHENDYLYFNNGDGTFREEIRSATGHNSRSSMGADAADFNNDGLPDVVVLDMLPDRQDILNTSYSVESYAVASQKLSAGFHPQYKRNMLFLNRGGGRFSEIGYLAGIEATDWSWAPLLFDADNDGWKDLLVTNGIWRRPNDRDFLQQAYRRAFRDSSDLAMLEAMPHVPIANFLFRNNGNLTFSNRAAEWGLGEELFSTGAAYVDLDNDGDLDLVTNNINDAASIYENTGTGRHFLSIRLEGAAGNRLGFGAIVTISAGGRLQMQELMPTRGFQSSVDPRLHFGLDSTSVVDSLTIVWPDHRYQVLTAVSADRELVIRHDDASGSYRYRMEGRALFTDVTDSLAAPYRHRENAFNDFTAEPLIPHQISREGPALAAGDVDGDGRDDLFAGGAKWQPASLLLQTDRGFVATDEDVWRADSLYEDVDAAFFDADGDGDLDLYVVSAGNEWPSGSEALRDRLYVNDGRGRFARGELPEILENGSAVRPADYDGDGDTDLFVGGRVVARSYGTTPRSYVLRNDGGTFSDVTPPELAEAGMITDAVWSDLDADGRLDLVLAGEWMPVRSFLQTASGFTENDNGLGDLVGWWSAVESADLNEDGAPDLILGNLGLNSRLRTSSKEPVRLYLGDFDADGELDQLLTAYRHSVSYALGGRDDVLAAFPTLARKYPTYGSFGAQRAADLFPKDRLASARVLEATTFASIVAINRGDGTFEPGVLPTAAQFSPVEAVLANDFDGDGHLDLLLGGNFSGVSPVLGRYDAGYGTLLLGDGTGEFKSLEPRKSGLWLNGEIRVLTEILGKDGTPLIVAARNDDRLQFIRVGSSQKH